VSGVADAAGVAHGAPLLQLQRGGSERLEVRAAAFKGTRSGERNVAGEQRAITVRRLAGAAVASVVPDDERVVDEQFVRVHHVRLVREARRE